MGHDVTKIPPRSVLFFTIAITSFLAALTLFLAWGLWSVRRQIAKMYVAKISKKKTALGDVRIKRSMSPGDDQPK